MALFSAMREPGLTAVFSLLPLLIAATISYIRAYSASAQDVSERFLPHLSSAIANGELFLFSFAMIGPLFWLCAVDKPRGGFPVRWLFILIVAALGFYAVSLYAFDVTQSTPMPEGLVQVSILFYIIYVTLHIILLRIMTGPGSLDDHFNKGAENLMRGLSPEAGQ